MDAPGDGGGVSERFLKGGSAVWGGWKEGKGFCFQTGVFMVEC